MRRNTRTHVGGERHFARSCLKRYQRTNYMCSDFSCVHHGQDTCFAKIRKSCNEYKRWPHQQRGELHVPFLLAIFCNVRIIFPPFANHVFCPFCTVQLCESQRPNAMTYYLPSIYQPTSKSICMIWARHSERSRTRCW